MPVRAFVVRMGPALIALGAAAMLATPAAASCVPSTPRENLERADAVFVGRVLSFDTSDGRAAMRVLRVRKGGRRLDRGDVVEVMPEHYPSSITIDWDPRPGERWRVYAQRRAARWITHDCLGTRRA